MADFKHTQGEVENRKNRIFVKDTYKSIATIEVQNNFDIVKGKAIEDVEADANASLFVESLNTTNQCGFTPKQLLEQRNELLNAIVSVKEWLDTFEAVNPDVFNKYGNVGVHIKVLNAIESAKY